MKMNIIEMVQDIHNDLDFDEVNTIDQTPESMQVAHILKSTYLAMMSSRNWSHLRKLVSLIPSVDISRPTHLTLPEGVKQLEFVNYETTRKGSTRFFMTELKWIEPDAFLRKQNALNSEASNVQQVLDVTGIKFLVRNDVQPTCFTSFDDKHLVCDSYNIAIEDTLQEQKVQAMAYMMPSWTMDDYFVPDLPIEAFAGLVEEAKAKASVKLRQQVDQKSEQEAQRQRQWLSRYEWSANGGLKYPSYGRGRVKTYVEPTFRQGK